MLTTAEQSRLVTAIQRWEQAGNEGRLGGRTFTAPRRWMKGKGRVTMQVNSLLPLHAAVVQPVRAEGGLAVCLLRATSCPSRCVITLRGICGCGQFGCVYNYARDAQGNPPGILVDEWCEPMPRLLQHLIKRLVRWGVLPAAMEPDSAIVNLYSEARALPPPLIRLGCCLRPWTRL